MCGIFLTSPSNTCDVKKALQIHQFRGPDSQQLVDLDFCTLGVNRLSISDLQNGNQPLKSDDGSIFVIFNGAIYNFTELCSRFNYKPKSMNDGEIIHYLYQRFGLDFAQYLEGMFAIIIVDIKKQDIIYCVDQVGIKPLFLVELNSEFILSSTLQAIPERVRSHSKRVLPNIVWSKKRPPVRIGYTKPNSDSLLDLLRKSVGEQIPTDVPWGCMLSGGVDSSLITALAIENCDEDVHTFTCGTPDSSDLLAARSVSELLGTIHHEVKVDPTPKKLAQIVKKVVRETGSFEIWTVMGGVGTYLTAQYAAKNGFKVLISGEGADELFAGYDEFTDVAPPLLEARLLQYQADLAVSECLRLDRTTMANSIEARVPFLARPIMDYAKKTPVEHKLDLSGKIIRRKAELRDCACQVLPKKVSERSKVEFKDGSGLAFHLYALGEKYCTKKDVDLMKNQFPSFGVTDQASAWLLGLWMEYFGDTIGTNCEELRQRGIIRQEVNDYIRFTDTV